MKKLLPAILLVLIGCGNNAESQQALDDAQRKLAQGKSSKPESKHDEHCDRDHDHDHDHEDHDGHQH